MGIEFIVPILIAFVFLYGLLKEVDVFNAFISGAKEGLLTAFKILPLLIGIITAISVFRASGALNILVNCFSPLGKLIGLPSEAIPLAIMRPISGSGSLALFSDIIKNNGADTFIGLVAAVMTSSTETTLYTIGVYTGAVGIKKSGIALSTALLADIIAAVLAVIVVKLFYF